MILPKASRQVVDRAETVVKKAGDSIRLGVAVSCVALIVAVVALFVAVAK